MTIFKDYRRNIYSSCHQIYKRNNSSENLRKLRFQCIHGCTCPIFSNRHTPQCCYITVQWFDFHHSVFSSLSSFDFQFDSTVHMWISSVSYQPLLESFVCLCKLREFRAPAKIEMGARKRPDGGGSINRVPMICERMFIGIKLPALSDPRSVNSSWLRLRCGVKNIWRSCFFIRSRLD